MTIATFSPIIRSSDSFLLDAYSGKGGFATGQYLVPHAREQADEFKRRQQLAVYPNFCRKITDVFNGYLWKTPPQRTDLDDTYTQFIANCNGVRGKLNAVMANYQRLATILGSVYIIVDKSNKKATSKADETLPYLTVRLPSQLIYELKDSQGEWEEVTFSETTNGVIHYRTFTKTAWKYSSEINGDPITSGTHDLGRVPVVKLHAAAPLDPTSSHADSFFYDLAQLNWSLFNLHSELQELLRDQAFAILTIPAATKAERDSLTNMTIGTKNGIVYNPVGGGKPEFIAPPASSAEQYETRIANSVTDIYRIANLEFVGGVQASGVALAFHFSEANSSMRTTASQAEAAENEILELVALWQGQEPQGHISYNDDFNLVDMASELAIAMDVINMSMGSVFTGAIKKRVAKQILANDVAPTTMSEIEDEIDAQGDVYGDRIAATAGVQA